MNTQTPSADNHHLVHAPFDGEVIAELSAASMSDVDRALDVAHRLFRDRPGWLPAHERIGVLERTARLMSSQHGELTRLIATEGGKPLKDAQIEVTRAIDSVRLCVEHLRNPAEPGIPMGMDSASENRLALTHHEPVGVVVAVSAFNHPLNLIVHQVAPAIAAGCPVIVKPADVTPLCCLRFVELLHTAGLPEDWARVLVITDNHLAQRLVTDPRVGYFSFIGSAAVGWMLRAKLAPGTRCALEHGGAAPVLLADDADLELAARALTKGGYYHAGQVCVSVQRVFAPASIAHSFAELLAHKVERLKVGDPQHATTDVGPLIRKTEVDRVESWVRDAVEQGAQCLTGGERVSDRTHACTVLIDAPQDAKISRLEVFGPVVSVYPYEDVSEAIAQANALPFAFHAAVFTENLDRAVAAFHGLDASAVMVNDHTAFRIDGMPFAGLRQSGLGVGGIPHTLNDMQVRKMLVVHSRSSYDW